MSGPSSEARTSISSEPSATSSRTLHSRWSSSREGNGEGSSSQRPTLAGSRHSGGRGAAPSNDRAQHTGSPLGSESIDEQDFARRRHRNRRSGGFLLNDSFSSGPSTRHESDRSGPVDNAKGKRSSRNERSDPGTKQSRRLQVGNPELSSSSSLSPASSRRHRSTDSSGQGNKQDSYGEQTREAEAIPGPSSTVQGAQNRPGMDPQQIVDLALQLSEGRRRNLTAGQIIAPLTTQPQGPGRRAISGSQRDSSFRDRGAGGSLRQYLNEQRRVSRNISPFGSKSKGDKEPTAGTLDRVQKAITFFELRWQYLRLLEYLPPLKPDAFAPGNFVLTANNVPGSPHAYISRMPSHAGKQHELGRKYNPLQYLRNRRTRARERKSLDHMPEDFDDLNKVRNWVDRIAIESERPGYRRQDGVFLPDFHENHATDAVPGRPTRHRMGWNFTSGELLADMVWLEQSDNKYLIEDRHGHKIFSRPQEQSRKPDFLSPRASGEYSDKRRRSWVESLPGGANDPVSGEESITSNERGRKKRLLPGFRSESPKVKKHRKTKERRDSSSSSSDSEPERHNLKSNGTRNIVDTHTNTGALGLHLEGLLEREAMEAKSKSPPIVSPDTPDKWGVGHNNIRDGRTERSSIDSTRNPNDSHRVGFKTGVKSPLTNLSITSEPRSSLDVDASMPSSPFHMRNFSHTESEPSPPPSRGREIKKNKKSRLDIFRSEGSVKASKHDSLKRDPSSVRTDDEYKLPPDDMNEGVGLGLPIKSIRPHIKNESVSTLPSPNRRKEQKEGKDPSSAVTRFFKGVKNEGSKVGEFIFKRDRAADDTDSDSDLNDAPLPRIEIDESRKHDSALGRSDTAGTVSTTASKQGNRYHIELPSFRSHNDLERMPTLGSDMSPIDDHVTKQARARANNRSPRFDKLAPPRIELGSMSAKSSPTGSPQPERDNFQLRPYHTNPDDTNPRGLSATSYADSHISGTSTHQDHASLSRPNFERRHWSITDDDPNNPRRRRSSTISANTSITASDLARVRALFLCSGIKAREINRRAYTTRSPPAPWLKSAANLSDTTALIPVPRKEEHALAARILVRQLEASTTALQSSAETYRNSTLPALTNNINALKARVEAVMFPRVREAADEALRITSVVSAEKPLEVKQVGDRIERIVRVRRRRTRWVRRVGWMVVEWMVLGVMWWVWLVVVLVGWVRRGVRGMWRVGRWLLWL